MPAWAANIPVGKSHAVVQAVTRSLQAARNFLMAAMIYKMRLPFGVTWLCVTYTAEKPIGNYQVYGLGFGHE